MMPSEDRMIEIPAEQWLLVWVLNGITRTAYYATNEDAEAWCDYIMSIGGTELSVTRYRKVESWSVNKGDVKARGA
jgi:hypothetical protein